MQINMQSHKYVRDNKKHWIRINACCFSGPKKLNGRKCVEQNLNRLNFRLFL